MSTLTGQFISQSYGGLIQLSTSTGIVTGSSTQLQDGFGTNLGLFIRTSANGSGSFSGSGDFNINGMTVGVGSGNILSNTVVGRNAFKANTTGTNNVAIGNGALESNSVGTSNTAVGQAALISNTSGSNNTAVGRAALQNNTTGINNTAVGRQALQNNVDGGTNVAVGYTALFNNTNGGTNTAVGNNALFTNQIGNNNTAAGGSALATNTSGSDNTAVGRSALFANTTGNSNTAVGKDALNSNTTGGGNTAVGQEAGEALTGGNNNIFVGYDAGQAFGDGSDNIFIGYQSGFGLVSGSGNMVIGKTSSTFTASISQNILLYTSDVQRARFDPTSGWFLNNVLAGTGSYVLTYESTGQVKYATYETFGARLFNEGSFSHSTTLSGSAGVSASITYDQTGSLNGISLVSGSRITVLNPGTYNIQFSAQCDAFDGADTIWIWFKKNGTNIAKSASKLVMQNNTANIMTVNIFDNAVLNDYYEIVWQNNAGDGKLISDAATGNIPAIPSIIVTINQVN